MSNAKAAFEVYIVAIGRRDGQRYADRLPLNVPLDLALGRLEELSDLQVREALNDLAAEQERRATASARHAEIAAACGGYDPFASQVLR